jgi:single-strand DNA-binding protein
MTLNKMMIIGNLGADPELRYTPSGKAVTNLRVAVNDRSRGPDGEWTEETMWIGVEVWEQAAERAAEQLRKGHKIFAEGQLRAREFEGRDGQKRTALELRFARIVNLERRSREEGGEFGGYGGGQGGDIPVARPRGAEARDRAPGGSSAPNEMLEVDDIPF